MILTITGLPGNGKTLYALWWVVQWAKREGRQVWYHGIPELSPELGWFKVSTQTEQINGEAIEVPQWWLCPANSIVVIDEAQKAGFGTRARGQVPEWARKLETHRHLGVDLVFITQDPSLIDAHDRRLSELHFHIVRKWGMQSATIHEFRPVRDNVAKTRKDSIRRGWKFPKEVYGWYRSAEAHTHKARIPLIIWLYWSMPFIIGALAWAGWHFAIDPHRNKPSSSTPSAASAPAGNGNGGSSNARPVLTAAEYQRQFYPRIPGFDYTAPAYDEVTKPQQAPYPAACVFMPSKGCRCYTQQGTMLQTPAATCKSIVDGGFFIAWQDKPSTPQPTQVVARVDPPVAEPMRATSMGGVPLGSAATDYGGTAPEPVAPRPRNPSAPAKP